MGQVFSSGPARAANKEWEMHKRRTRNEFFFFFWMVRNWRGLIEIDCGGFLLFSSYDVKC